MIDESIIVVWGIAMYPRLFLISQFLQVSPKEGGYYRNCFKKAMENWHTTPDGMKKVLKFDSFTALTDFLQKLGPIADQLNHHPDFEVKKASEIHFTLMTHSEKAVTEKDRELAGKIDELYEE